MAKKMTKGQMKRMVNDIRKKCQKLFFQTPGNAPKIVNVNDAVAVEKIMRQMDEAHRVIFCPGENQTK